jgi:hypothetical protein
MPSPITERAVAIINALAGTAPKQGPLRTAEYVKALPQEAAALARVLTSERVVEAARHFQEYDRLAVKQQRNYRLPRIIGLFAVLSSVLLAGLSVYASAANDPIVIEAVRPYLARAQWVLLVLLLACAATIDNLVADRKLYALAWVYGSSLQLVIARLAFLSPVAAHVESYKVMDAVLSRLNRRLPEAREAAATGSFETVRWFA